MTQPVKRCKAGHKMTAENIYHHKKHGHIYDECRECIRLARPNGYTVADQRRIARIDIIAEDTSQITECPKCAGLLTYGRGDHLEDAVSCIYCGWRPSARMAVEL